MGNKAEAYLLQREDLCEASVEAFQALITSMKPTDVLNEKERIGLG